MFVLNCLSGRWARDCCFALPLHDVIILFCHSNFRAQAAQASRAPRMAPKAVDGERTGASRGEWRPAPPLQPAQKRMRVTTIVITEERVDGTVTTQTTTRMESPRRDLGRDEGGETFPGDIRR